MSAGPGLVHEATIYTSTADFLDRVVPFVSAGVDAGEPVLLALDPHRTGLVVDALAGHAGLVVLDPGDGRDHPLSGLRRTRDAVAAHPAPAGRRVRMLGELPPAGRRRAWSGWAPYEAMVNHLHADLPLEVLCPFDRRTTPGAMLAQVERTHRIMIGPGGVRAENPLYVAPTPFLVDHDRGAADLVERRPPDVTLAEPSLPRARAEVLALVTGVLDPTAADGFVFAANEVLTNAVTHGRPPVGVRIWASPTRVTVAVDDRGPGVPDPYAGLDHRPGPGDGLRLARRLSDQLLMVTRPDGFTVYLTTNDAPR